MKKLYIALTLAFAITLIFPFTVLARMGDMGFWSGVSEGRPLPGTTQQILASETNANTTDRFVYHEIIWIDGEPVEFEGVMVIESRAGRVRPDAVSGSYEVTYRITPAHEDQDVLLTRTITFVVNFRREGNQTVRDWTVRDARSNRVQRWEETIVTPTGTYTLDRRRSNINISFLEDQTPGVLYYKGNLSMHAVFTRAYDNGNGNGNDNGNGNGGGEVIIRSTGSIYGFTSAWSAAETHRIDTWVDIGGEQVHFQTRPSLSVNKTLMFTENEPQPVSFRGNYMEIVANQSSLSYDIFIRPIRFNDNPRSGSITIPTFNTFEQLIAPDTSHLRGHFAESDIAQLFAMEVFTGVPARFRPDQAMTRGQYVMAMARAAKVPLPDPPRNARARNTTSIVFPDVTPDRVEHPYIIAFFNAGLAIGRDRGNFFIDAPITMEEAIVIMVRVLGLTNIAPNPTPVTPFTDNDRISDWARREVYAAYRLGLIAPDDEGRINPLTNISNATGAALVNRMIDYMRHELVTAYTDHITNYIH
ncbi:MAG: S-layer homology domain-containing protein [Defluviitaleaceae bacterium]|nr:S-layer homology domain-containing protein [Defluviitaleaceae bacterium]